jgi:hypothetical protein
MEFGKFLIHNYYIKYPNPEKKEAVCFWKHTICSFGLSEEDTEVCKKIFAYAKHYSVCPNNTFLDKWAADYLAKLGKSSVCGVTYSAPDYTFVQGDYTLFAFFPIKLEKEFTELYKNIKEFGSTEANKYLAFVTTKTKIFVIILENKKLADFWRQEAIELYKKAKKDS